MSTTQLLNELGLGSSGEGYATTGPYLFPLVTLSVLIGTVVLMSIKAFAGRRHRQVSEELKLYDLVASSSLRKFVFSASLIFAYILATNAVGFFLATPPFLVIHSWVIGSRHMYRDLVFAVAFTATVYLVFERLLMISVP